MPGVTFTVRKCRFQGLDLVRHSPYHTPELKHLSLLMRERIVKLLQEVLLEGDPDFEFFDSCIIHRASSEGLPSHAYFNTLIMQPLFDAADRVFTKVNHGGNQGGVCLTLGQDLIQVFRFTRTT